MWVVGLWLSPPDRLLARTGQRGEHRSRNEGPAEKRVRRPKLVQERVSVSVTVTGENLF